MHFRRLQQWGSCRLWPSRSSSSTGWSSDRFSASHERSSLCVIDVQQTTWRSVMQCTVVTATGSSRRLPKKTVGRCRVANNFQGRLSCRNLVCRMDGSVQAAHRPYRPAIDVLAGRAGTIAIRDHATQRVCNVEPQYIRGCFFDDTDENDRPSVQAWGAATTIRDVLARHGHWRYAIPPAP